MKGRAEAEKFILEWADAVDPSGENAKIYRAIFPKMSDEQFVEMAKSPLPIYMPNGGPVDIDVERNIAVARKFFNHEFRKQLWLTDPRTGVCSLTAYKHTVIDLPCRRQSQLVTKKLSVAEHNRTIDAHTGQPVGASKGSAFSFPQIYVMFSKGYVHSIREWLSTRGGNTKAMKEIDRQIRNTGSASQRFPGQENTRNEAVKTLATVFRAMHIDSTIMR